MCGDQSPDLPDPFPLRARVKCNRIAGHDGPHRKLRAADFSTAVEWADGHYVIPAAPGAH